MSRLEKTVNPEKMAAGKLCSMSFRSKTPSSRTTSPTMPGGPSVKRITRANNVTLTYLEIEAQTSIVTEAASAHLYLKKRAFA
jgi:hypothetical protein